MVGYYGRLLSENVAPNYDAMNFKDSMDHSQVLANTFPFFPGKVDGLNCLLGVKTA